MLNAGIVLAIMILPTIVSLTRELLLATPRSLLEASLALGSTRSEAIAVVVDAARPGILGAIILALGRALGETMAVTMVIGNNPQVSLSLCAPQYTMAAVIANEFTEADGASPGLAHRDRAGSLLATLLVNGRAIARPVGDGRGGAMAERWPSLGPRGGGAANASALTASWLCACRHRAARPHRVESAGQGLPGSTSPSSPTCPSRWGSRAAAWRTPSWAPDPHRTRCRHRCSDRRGGGVARRVQAGRFAAMVRYTADV
jgi:hypothetical protein